MLKYESRNVAMAIGRELLIHLFSVAVQGMTKRLDWRLLVVLQVDRLAAFLRGQTSDSALRTARRYLDDHPRLAEDLRRKVLQHLDELERTVRIRKVAALPTSPSGTSASRSATPQPR